MAMAVHHERAALVSDMEQAMRDANVALWTARREFANATVEQTAAAYEKLQRARRIYDEAERAHRQALVDLAATNEHPLCSICRRNHGREVRHAAE